jgi:hypothetical protein
MHLEITREKIKAREKLQRVKQPLRMRCSHRNYVAKKCKNKSKTVQRHWSPFGRIARIWSSRSRPFAFVHRLSKMSASCPIRTPLRSEFLRAGYDRWMYRLGTNLALRNASVRFLSAFICIQESWFNKLLTQDEVLRALESIR